MFCVSLGFKNKGSHVSNPFKQLKELSVRSFVFLSCRVADSQTLVWDLRLFVRLQTFLLLFYICLKPRLFCTSHHKTTSKHPRIQNFWLHFAKNCCDFSQKREKRFHPAGSFCAWAGLWPAVVRTFSTSRSFLTILKHNVGSPAVQRKSI